MKYFPAHKEIIFISTGPWRQQTTTLGNTSDITSSNKHGNNIKNHSKGNNNIKDYSNDNSNDIKDYNNGDGVCLTSLSVPLSLCPVGKDLQVNLILLMVLKRSSVHQNTVSTFNDIHTGHIMERGGP